MTLWCVARAPLMLGARLPLDPEDTLTLGLLTNPEVLAVQNASSGNSPVNVTAGSGPDAHAWTAVPTPAPEGTAVYLALFNAGESQAVVGVSLSGVPGLAPSPAYCVRDLWTRTDLGRVSEGTWAQSLAPHEAGLYLVQAC